MAASVAQTGGNSNTLHMMKVLIAAMSVLLLLLLLSAVGVCSSYVPIIGAFFFFLLMRKACTTWCTQPICLVQRLPERAFPKLSCGFVNPLQSYRCMVRPASLFSNEFCRR